MANRREFIRLGLAAPAVAMGAGAFASSALAAAALPARADGAPLADLFVFDDRFAEARLRAGEESARGARTHGFAGDPMLLWDTLGATWRRGPVTLGGVTTDYGLFVLETLAADRRMRLTHRGEVSARDTALVAWVIAPRAA